MFCPSAKPSFKSGVTLNSTVSIGRPVCREKLWLLWADGPLDLVVFSYKFVAERQTDSMSQRKIVKQNKTKQAKKEAKTHTL